MLTFKVFLFYYLGKLIEVNESKLKCSKSSLLFLIHLSHIHVHLTFHLHLHLLFFGVLACFVYDILHVLVSIRSLLTHILHLLRLHHLLFFQHLLLLHSCLVFFLWHLILLLISLWGILNKMSVVRCIHFMVLLGVWLSIFGWWDVLTFVSVVEFDSL